MYNYQKKSLPNNAWEIIVDIPAKTIKEQKEKTLKNQLEKLTIPGYRPGKAPKSIGQKYIKPEETYEQLIKDLLPPIYQEIIQKENLRPIVSPKVELTKAKEGEDWQFKITIAEKPLIQLGDYRERIKKLKIKAKPADIWVPGKTKEKEEKKDDETKLLNQIFQELLSSCVCQMADLIIEEELNRRLSQLVDDVQKLGLTIETYLSSKGITLDELKNQIKKEVEEMYKLEFILQEIAEKEGIVVEKSDLDKIFSVIQDPKERERAQQNSYFYSMLLRKQKTLDFLLNL
jgi:trigger factor